MQEKSKCASLEEVNKSCELQDSLKDAIAMSDERTGQVALITNEIAAAS